MEITIAGNSHNCRFNKRHRIARGTPRLTIKEDGSDRNYCLPCARAFLAKGIERLHELQTQIEEQLSSESKQ